MSDQGIIKRLQDRTSSVSSEDPVATPSSAGTPSTKAATKRKAKRRATSRGDSSGDEYCPAEGRAQKLYTGYAPHSAPIRKPGYFKTAYKCFECTRDGQDCYVPDKENVGPCLYGPCQRGGMARCLGHQRVNISESRKKDPAAMLRHRIRLMMIKVANEGHKMNSAGEYLEWTPFSSGAVNLEISRSRWAKMAATEDPTLENDIDQYLKAKRSKKEAEEHKKKAEVKNEYNSGEVIDLSVSESEQDDVFAHDPLKDVIKDTLPKKHVELQKYLAELHKAEESLNSQMEVVRATMVQVKYKLAHAK